MGDTRSRGPLLQLRGALAPARTQSLIKPKAVDEITMRSLLIAFVATTANALQLPMQPRTAATAAVAIATPLPALAVHELAPGTAYGDVALNYDGMISAGVGFMLSAGKCQHHVTRISCELQSLRHRLIALDMMPSPLPMFLFSAYPVRSHLRIRLRLRTQVRCGRGLHHLWSHRQRSLRPHH